MPGKKKASDPVDSLNQTNNSQVVETFVSDELNRAIVDSVMEGILRIEPVIMTDSKGKINYWNGAAEQMFGFSKEEMIGKGIQDLFYDQQFYQIYPIKTSISDRGIELEKEIAGRIYELTAKGRLIERIPLEVQLSYVHLKDETYVVLIARNITERMLQIEELQKAKNEAEKANRLKSEFLSNMSHEIRTPMNAINGFAEILLNNIQDEEQKGWIKNILQSGNNLLSLIKDILDLSKIEAEKMELHDAEYSIRRLLNEVRETFSITASQKQIKFTLQIHDDVPDMYIGDEHRLRQILINFLSNAFKFTPEGGNVTVRFNHKKETGYFEIEDTGIGIPQDKIHTIFNPFEQIDGTYTRQYSGTGLGLAITHRLVELMEGKIEVLSEERKGSNFKVQIKMIASLSTEFSETEDKEESKFKHILQSTERYRKGMAMVRKWIQFAEGDREIEDIICEAISLLPDKYDDLAKVIQMRDEKGTDFLTHSLKGETLNLHLNDVAKIAKKMNEATRHIPIDWKALDNDLADLKEVISLIPPDYLEKHMAGRDLSQITKRDTILIVEDNVLNQKLMKTIIEKLGFACDLASNGLNALNLLMDHEYLMLLLDMQMPVMDGLELIKIIRNDIQLKKLYVVAVTAHAMKGDRERFLNAGCNDYLAKPIDFDKLSHVIEKTIKQKQTDNESTDH